MKVLLLKDVYKLGHAGDVKKVADGYARNYLIPQRLATLATSTAVKQAETLRQNAAITRAKLNAELAGVAEKLNATSLTFPVKAGETGKLYGSVTPAQITEEIKKATGLELDRRTVGHQPLRELGEYKVPVRLTADLIAHVRVLIHREGEALKKAAAEASAEVEAKAPLEAEAMVESPAELAEAPADDAQAESEGA
ncbi:MAG: 50S ribosomal protein L9 [Anaerolineales bacterium]|nr:50S ribosomal protein L9 [Anaerolineales bacterium]